MSLIADFLVAVCTFLMPAATASISAATQGLMEGYLKIVSMREVELADGTPAPVTAENYADYPLIVLSQDRKQEVTRVTADGNGTYRAELPPGDYVLDLQHRPRGRARATPRPFTVVSGQTARVDMNIDTGIR